MRSVGLHQDVHPSLAHAHALYRYRTVLYCTLRIEVKNSYWSYSYTVVAGSVY